MKEVETCCSGERVRLNLGGCAKLEEGGRGGSDAEQRLKERGLLHFVLSIMKLKKVERLCREVWRSCQQVCMPVQLYIYIYKLSICVLVALWKRDGQCSWLLR